MIDSNVAKTIFLDTNIYLHYQLFDQINWLEVIKASEVMIVVPPVTVRELNKHKDLHPRQRVKARAAKVLKKLASLFGSDCQVNIRDNVEMRLEDREPMVNFAEFQLDQSIQDDQLIASIIMFRNEEHKAEVILVTADAGLTLKVKAKRQGIPTITMPDNLKLAEELDSNQIHIRELEQKVRALEIKIPQISLVFADGSQHTTFVLPHPMELLPEEIVSKQKLLEQQYPKVKQRFKQTSRLPEHLASMAEVVAKLTASMGNLLPEDIEKYNTELDKYYQAYYKYLPKELQYGNLRRRTIKLSIFAANDGGAPAEDVDVFLHFPNGFKLTDEQGFPNAPETPEPPVKPRTQRERLLETMSGTLVSMPPMMSRIPGAVLPPQNISAPNVRNTGSYDVDFHIQRLKHKLQEPADPLYVIFESFENARSFKIDYRLLAANIPNEVTGHLHVIIEKD